MNFLKKLLINSVGLKRLVASLLSALLPVVAIIPQLASLYGTLQAVASWAGVAGLAHAVPSKSLSSTNIFVNLAAALQALILAAEHFPQLAPYVGLMQIIASVLGALGFGGAIKK